MSTINLQKAMKFISELPENTVEMVSKGGDIAKQVFDFVSKTENQILMGSAAAGFMLQPIYFTLGAVTGFKGTEYAQNMLPERFKKFVFDRENTVMNGVQKGIQLLTGKPKYLAAAALIGLAYMGYLPIFAKGSFVLASAIGNHVFLNTTQA